MFATPDPSRSSPLARNLRLLQIEAGPHNDRVFNRPVISRLVQGSPTSTPVIPYAVSGVTPARARFTVPLLFRQRRWRGSSPLARGLPSLHDGDFARPWIIPARAGFTWRIPAPNWISMDHPRSRGVYHRASRRARRRPGSSPLARGLPKMNPTINGVNGIIPARAGFTGDGPREGLPPRDHPRSRGVYDATRTEDLLKKRIIPARAGFTGQ